MRILLSIFITLFLGLFCSQQLLATPQVSTSVSDNQVTIGDIFLLTIEIDDNDSDYQLDTRPLEKEFNVYRPSKSQRSAYINGDFSQQTQWQIRLQAKRTGELTIPVLKIGPLTTQAIRISVGEAPEQASGTADNKVFMENSINKSSVYVGQPLIFTTRIYIGQATDNLNLTGPELQSAEIEVYGQDKNSETIRNGIRYQTITRQFQIIADKPGDFIINSPLLSGDLRKTVPVNDWQNRIIGVPINVRGDSINIEVKDKPADYQGEWLVSEDVRLEENTPLTQQTFPVGEPITRNITLQIASIKKEKMPTISFNYPEGLRFYPDQDQLTEGQINGLLYSQRSMRHAIIPSKTGELTLPEIKIAWWNSVTNKQEYAVLPAQTLTILAADKQPGTVQVQPADIDLPAATSKVSTDNSSLLYWQITTTLLLLLLILLFLYHLHYRRLHTVAQHLQVPSFPSGGNQVHKDLQEALLENNAPRVYRLLLTYLPSENVNLKSLTQLVEVLDLPGEDKEQFAKQINLLEKACCSVENHWDAAPLSRLIEKYLQQKRQDNKNSIMDLNP
ncbi:BatD family protein [Psychromonas sp.]|uniref:BatD family protein n=1 Tax=Psychromonas sp. TaxID=1884585 RepID=UPI003564312E